MEKEHQVKRVRDELNQCRSRVKLLKEETSSIESKLKSSSERHKIDLLLKAQRKVKIELNREIELEEMITEQLEQVQLELEKTIIQQAKLSEIEKEIEHQETSFKYLNFWKIYGKMCLK